MKEVFYMTLEGANNFNENDISTIYTMNSVQTGQYCVVVPKNIGDKVRMLVDLNMKKSFDSLVSNTITKDTLINDINDEYSNIEKDYKGSVLVIPMLDIDEFNNSINSNDKQTIFNETKKIGSITSEIYRKLCESGVDKAKIDQKIVIVEKKAFEDFIQTVEYLLSRITDTDARTKEKQPEQWLDTADVCVSLQLNRRTVYSLREQGKLPFSQIQHRVYYKAKDIKALVDSLAVKTPKKEETETINPSK